MRTLLVPKLALAALAMSAALGAPDPGVSAQNVKETFTAFAINMNSGPKTATVDISIERWSTDAERDALLASSWKKRTSTGQTRRCSRRSRRCRRPATSARRRRSAWDLRYARQNPMEDGGRQIVVGTDRPVGFWEARNQPRSMDYPFTILEMRLNKEDKGEGKMLAGTQIYIDKKTKNLVLENYGQQPVRLNEIRKLK